MASAEPRELSQEQLARRRETPVITVFGIQAADAAQNMQQRRGNCDDVPMEYRYPVSRRVADSLVSLFPLLVGALMVAATVRFFVDPSAHSHGTRQVVESVLFVAVVLLPAAVLGCAGLALTRKALSDRLVVTGDGLVSREGKLTRVRVTTIPWSSVTSFTVKRLGPHATVVTAVLNSGQQVKLPGTARRQVAATTTIAEELTTRLRTAV